MHVVPAVHSATTAAAITIAFHTAPTATPAHPAADHAKGVSIASASWPNSDIAPGMHVVPAVHSASTVAAITIVFHTAPRAIASLASATDGFSTKRRTRRTLPIGSSDSAGSMYPYS